MRDNLVRPYRVEVQRKESNPSFLIRPKMYVVHDNAANAKLVLKSCSGVTQLFCLNHTLNLVVQGALKSTILGSNIKNLLRKTRKLAVQVKKSPKLTEELKSTCKSLKVKYVSLKKSIYNISNYFDPYSRRRLTLNITTTGTSWRRSTEWRLRKTLSMLYPTAQMGIENQRVPVRRRMITMIV